MTETTWPAKPKIFTVWLFIGKTCRLLSSKAQPGSWALAKREEARNQCPQVSDGGSGSHLSTGWASRGSATPETLGAGRILQGGIGTQRREETSPCVLETQHPVKGGRESHPIESPQCPYREKASISPLGASLLSLQTIPTSSATCFPGLTAYRRSRLDKLDMCRMVEKAR